MRFALACSAWSAAALSCASSDGAGVCDYERLGCDDAVWIHFQAPDPWTTWRDGRWRVEARAEERVGGCEAEIHGWGGCAREGELDVTLYVANDLGGTPAAWIALSPPVSAVQFEVFREDTRVVGGDVVQAETLVVGGDVVPTYVPPLPAGDRCPTACSYADLDFPVPPNS